MLLVALARLVALVALLLFAAPPALAAGSPPGAPAVLPCREGMACPPPFPRYFPQTGFVISQDQFWDYFQRRG